MNHDESTIDSALTRDLRDALSELATPGRPPLAAITGRGRVHRRRRLAGFAGLGVTAAVVGTAIALGLTGALGVTQAPNTDAIHAGVPTRHRGANPGTVRTAAFVLTSNTNGTDTLTLTMSQTL